MGFIKKTEEELNDDWCYYSDLPSPHAYKKKSRIDDFTDQEKLTFILQGESKMIRAVFDGHKACIDDQFAELRRLIKKFRIELGIIKK